MKRVRHTHSKFAALNLGASGAEEDGAEGGGAVGLAIGTGFGAGVGAQQGMGVGPGAHPQDEDGIEAVDDKVDERPWSTRIKGKGRQKAGGIEMGERNAVDCVQWMGGKVLEHAGFQGLFLLLSLAVVLISGFYRLVAGCA